MESSVDRSMISSRTKKNRGPLLKIVLVGESEVGKSTIISTFINNEPSKENFKKSVGIDSIVKNVEINNKSVRIEIWDTAGNEKLRTMISTYYRSAHGVLLVYDYTNINSFYSLKNWLKEIKQFAPENCVKYLVCNKIDKLSPDTSTNSLSWMLNEEEVDKFVKQSFISKNVKVSAKNNIGIKELFETIAEEIMVKIDSDTLNIRADSFKIPMINGEYFNKEKKDYDRKVNNSHSQSYINRPDCCYK